jgi:hypothetical protein
MPSHRFKLFSVFISTAFQARYRRGVFLLKSF